MSGTSSVVPETEQNPLHSEGGFSLPLREVFPTRRLKGVAEIAGARIPYTLELPDQVNDEVPLVIANGYGAVQDAYDRLRHFVAISGKPAVSFEPPRSQSLLGGFHPLHLFHP